MNIHTSGHLDIETFGAWHRTIPYTLHPNPFSGFNFIDPRDADRYNTESINVYGSREIPDHVIDFLKKHFNWLDNISYSTQKFEPGMLLPWHTDSYAFFRKHNQITDVNTITRIIIFLEDWQPGHILQINNFINTTYKAGDWISWIGLTPHLAANLGHTNRYTLQITGTAK